MKRRARLAAQARGALKNKTDNEMLDIRYRGDGRTYEANSSKFLVQKSSWSHRCSTAATTAHVSRFPKLRQVQANLFGSRGKREKIGETWRVGGALLH
jgi:hypothetical protein